MNSWRGVAVIGFWLVWPFTALLLSFSLFGFGGQCAVDSCGPQPSNTEEVLFIAFFVVPPLIILGVWAYWRTKYYRASS